MLQQDRMFFLDEKSLNQRLDILCYCDNYKNRIQKCYGELLQYIKENDYLVLDDDKILMIYADMLKDIVSGFLADVNDVYGYKSMLRVIFYLNNLNFNKEIYQEECHEKIDLKYMTYDEMISNIELLKNPSEKLLVYMGFFNLLGDRDINVREAKISDIDFTDMVWKLYDGKVIKLKDEVLIGLLKDTLNQTECLPYSKPNKMTDDGVNYPNAYKFNSDSKYLFKTRKHPKSNDGLDGFKEIGINTIFRRLETQFGKIFNKLNIKTSGFIYKMYSINPNPDWDISEMRDIKMEKNYRINLTHAYTAYIEKYFS